MGCSADSAFSAAQQVTETAISSSQKRLQSLSCNLASESCCLLMLHRIPDCHIELYVEGGLGQLWPKKNIAMFDRYLTR